MDRAAAVTDVLVASVGAVAMAACASRRTIAATVAAVAMAGPVVAAALGALRFSGVGGVTDAHELAVHVASTVGMPALGLSLSLAAARPARARTTAAIGLVVLLVLSAALRGPGYRTVAGAIGMLAAAVASALLARRDRVAGAAGIFGAAAVIVDGLVIGGPGVLFGVSRTAWFHVVFATALACLGIAAFRAAER